MISLFLNTSSNCYSICLSKDNVVIDSFTKEYYKDLSKDALYQITKLLENNNITIDDINDIICVRGPGSFTGLRIGVTIAKTIAYFKNKNLYSTSSLEFMASSVKGDIIVPLIDARRGYVYASIFDKNYNCIKEECYIKLDKLLEEVSKLKGKPVFVTLDEFDFETDKFVPDFDNFFKLDLKRSEDSMTFVPTYLKRTEAEEKLNDNKDC